MELVMERGDLGWVLKLLMERRKKKKGETRKQTEESELLINAVADSTSKINRTRQSGRGKALPPHGDL